MIVAAGSVAVFLNIWLLIIKFKRNRWSDAALDFTILAGTIIFLKGSENLLLIGIFASLMVSIYLWFSPPKFAL